MKDKEVKMNKRFPVIALTAAAALALAACSSPSGGDDTGSGDGAATGEPIRIGVVTPLSGTYGSEGQEEIRGFELALDANDNQVAGHPIELVTADAFVANDAIAAVNKLISQDQVDFITGTYATPTSQAGSEEAAKNNVMWIETSAITDSLTQRGLESYIRTGARAFDFADASADFLINGLGDKVSEKSVYVDAESGPYGTAVAATQASKLGSAGWEVEQGSHASNATDVTDSVLAAKASDAAVWLLTGYNPDLTLLLRTAAAQNYHPEAIVLTGAGDAQSVFDAVGAKDIENVFVVAYSSLIVNPDYAPGIQPYYDAYKEKYDSEPLGTVSATAYTGMSAILELLKASDGKTDVKSLKEASQEVDVPFGGLPNGWGLQIDKQGQNQRIQLTTVQWRKDASRPAVWPAEAVAEGEELVFGN
jgi:branched-chain amino acid transport system substrate-binding protein